MSNNVVLIKPCKSKTTLEALLKKSVKLELASAAEKLSAAGFEVLAETPFVLVFKKDFEFTLFPSGKLLVRGLMEESVFKELALSIYGIVGVFE